MSPDTPRFLSPVDSLPPAPWRPDRVLFLLLGWTAVTTVVFWLPTSRGPMDGPTYTWGFMGFGGSGAAGEYWFPLAASALALVTLWQGWRGGRFPVHLLLVGWHGGLTALVLRMTLRDPEGFRFQGDTLGVDVNLGWGAVGLFASFSLLALGWAVRDLHPARRTRGGTGGDVMGATFPRVPPWSSRNTRLLAFALLLLPLQFILLRSGAPHGGSDQVGVLLTLLQWGVLSVAFRPPAGRRAGEGVT